MTIFLKGTTRTLHLKALFPDISIDKDGVPHVTMRFSPAINDEHWRRSEAARRGWKTRRAKHVPDENEWLKPDNKDNF